MSRKTSRIKMAIAGSMVAVSVLGGLAALLLMNSSLDIRQYASSDQKSDVLFGVGGFRPEFLASQQAKKTIRDYGFSSMTTSPGVFAWNTTYIKKTNSYNFTVADEMVNYANAENLKLHAHVLLWPHKMTPQWLIDEAPSMTKEQLRQVMKIHLQTIASRYKGKVYSYDVINEVLDENGNHRQSVFYDKLGEEYIELAFKYVHEADPNAKLFYNEYGTYSSKGGANKKALGAYELVKRLKEKGVPIDGVGFQSHVNLQGYTQNEVRDEILKYKELGVEIAISEMDVQVLTDEPSAEQLDAQSDAFRRFALACVSSENCYRFTVWGLSDKDSWFRIAFGRKESPLLFDENYQPKRAYLTVARALGLVEVIRDTGAVARVMEAEKSIQQNSAIGNTPYQSQPGESFSSEVK